MYVVVVLVRIVVCGLGFCLEALGIFLIPTISLVLIFNPFTLSQSLTCINAFMHIATCINLSPQPTFLSSPVKTDIINVNGRLKVKGS